MTSGLRERKKQQTRESISNAATTLFVRQGFDETTIAEVAAAADVAKMTVTNYFALKEDLVFDRHETIAGLLAVPVATRPAGVAVLAAVRDTYLAHLADHDPILGFVGLPFARLVTSSPALLTRERQIMDEQETRLGNVLMTEFSSSVADLGPRLAGVQLAGLVRVLYYDGRRRLLSGESVATSTAALRKAARAGFASLETSLPAAYTTG